MNPFSVLLIGSPGSTTDALKAELASRVIGIDGEYSTLESVLARPVAADKAVRLLIIHEPADLIAATVRRLRGRFATWPILALVESSVDSAALFAVNRAGADQVVLLPLNASDFGEALERLSARFQLSEGFHHVDRPSQVIAVSGGVPGAGATTIATALAAEIAAVYGARTILFEATLRMGVIAMNLNANPTTRLNDLLAEADKLEAVQFRKALTPISPKLELLAAASDLTRAVPDPVPKLVKLIELSRQAAEATVIDLSCTYDDLHFETLWAADQIVLLSDQSLPAVRTTRMILDAAGQTKSVKRIHVVLNKYDPQINGLTADRVSQALGGVGVLTVPNDYIEVMRAANEGRLLRDLAPKSRVLFAVGVLAKAVMGTSPPPDQGRTLLTRVLGMFQ